MIRSFFGTQEGDFSITFKSIKALCEAPPTVVRPSKSSKGVDVEAGAAEAERGRNLGSARKVLDTLINVRP